MTAGTGDLDTSAPKVRELTPAEGKAVWAVAVATAVLGLLGFANSFARVQAAAAPSFGWLAWTVPLGVDVGIAVFSALDIVLARLDMRLRWLRLIPWSLTAATVYLNISGEPTLIGQVAHTALPALWVVAVEVGAHAIRVRAGLSAPTRMDRIRRSRWLLAFPSTALLWRRMVLWEVRSYPAALARERARLLALTDLQDAYGGRGKWRRKAPRRARMLYRLGEHHPAGPVRAQSAPPAGLAPLFVAPLAPPELISAPFDAPPLPRSAPAMPGSFANSAIGAPETDGGALIDMSGASSGAEIRAGRASERAEARRLETINAPPTAPLSAEDLDIKIDTYFDLPARPGADGGAESAPDGDENAPWPTDRDALEALLDKRPPPDDESNYSVGKRLAPVIGLHEGTARRYVADWREKRAAERAALGPTGAFDAPLPDLATQNGQSSR